MKFSTCWLSILCLTIGGIYPGQIQAKENKQAQTSSIDQCLQKTGDALSQCLEKNKEEKNDDGLISWIVLLAVAIIAPVAALTCFNCPDVWVFSAAAAAWLFGEFATMDRYRKRSEHIKKILEDKDVEKQIATLRSAQLHSESGVKAAEEKIMWATGAAIGFTAAAGVAALLVLNPFDLFGAGASFNCDGGLLGGLIDNLIALNGGSKQNIKNQTSVDALKKTYVANGVYQKKTNPRLLADYREYETFKSKLIHKIQDFIIPSANAFIFGNEKKDNEKPKNEEEERNKKKTRRTSFKYPAYLGNWCCGRYWCYLGNYCHY